MHCHSRMLFSTLGLDIKDGEVFFHDSHNAVMRVIRTDGTIQVGVSLCNIAGSLTVQHVKQFSAGHSLATNSAV